MILTAPKSSLLGPSPQTTGSYSIPAPKGIDCVSPLAEMEQRSSIFQYNLVSAQYGAKVRTGYENWATSVGADGVRTIIPFVGSTTAQNRLFACAKGGIYNVTASVAAPAAAIAFVNVTANSGYGAWNNYVTIGGSFCQYCDEDNGYYLYEQATGLWTRVTGAQVTGVNPNNLVFCMTYKSRAWFIEKGTGDAWYLPVGAVIGAATRFSFGNKFRHGGTLAALFNWTVDGGIGVDDYLVAVSTGGDVVVYKGDDPSVATSFLQQGQWYIGAPPVGRRIGGNFGGDLYLLSSYGIIPIAKLMSGQIIGDPDLYASAQISPIINEEMAASRSTLGWEIKYVPSEALLLVSAPLRSSFSQIQFCLALNNKGWIIYKDIPYATGDALDNVFYIGTNDGRVLRHVGNVDTTSDGAGGWQATAINFSLLQAFVDPGPPNTFKRIQFLRPIFIGSAIPDFVVEARYDYDISELFGSFSSGVTSGALWDVALWDVGIWTGGFIVLDNLMGGEGMGRSLGVALAGRASVKTTLIKIDVMTDHGNML